ncbi:MAG TPA: oligoribonuclease [Candidatus Poseidoniales archaeon]|nr:oligoribonuclease [Candidatus Poseidoniales archaeon]
MTADRLIWIDLEMTGLDPEENVIIEIATIVTDGQLNIIAEGPNIAVFQNEDQLAKMDEWNVTHHTANGLIETVRESEISTATAEIRTLEFLREHCEEGQHPLCGNTIGQDRRFLRAHMPDLADFCHYRSVDVTSVKELARRWYPESVPFNKPADHRALDDIKGSIDELSHYREQVFR